MDHKKMVREGYNRLVEAYLAERGREGDDLRMLDEFIPRLPRGAKVLDAGCGAGEPVTKRLVEFFQVTGVDISEEQIKRARKLVPGADLICQDMTKLDLPDNHFDGICSFYAIIHIPREEHAALLKNFHRMLMPGGLALLCLGAEDLEEDVEDFLGTVMYWSHYDTPTYLEMIRKTGFKVMLHREVPDGSCPDARHLFVLAQKAGE
jgi:SAM-dependent methyltransferase